MEAFDLIVIGGGPAGYTAAIRGAQHGMRVALVEKEPALGGTCLRVGCIPSKVLLESSGLWEEARERLGVHGIQVEGVQLDLGAMMRRKERIVQTLSRGIDSLLRKNGVVRWQGRGRLAGSRRVVVEGAEGTTVIEGEHILLATGSRPAVPPGIELDGRRIGTSTEALAYEEVPRRLVVIGAGYIGLELGTVWRRLGAQVTVVESLDRILPGLDDEIVQEAQRLLAGQGLQFLLGRRVRRAYVDGEDCVVELVDGESLRADRVLVATGRVPNVDGLGLESVGIRVDARGYIPVGEGFATAAPGVYAVGDVVGGPMLAHKAEQEGVACVDRLAGGYGRVNYTAIPSVVYTDPEIASVGRTEAQLQREGIAYRKGVFPFRANGRARTLERVEGKVKVLADAGTDRLLGVHIIGPRAGDLIAEAVAALEFGASSEDLALVSHAHPSLSEALKEAALAVMNRALHI